jgi:hypothetical protein
VNPITTSENVPRDVMTTRQQSTKFLLALLSLQPLKNSTNKEEVVIIIRFLLFNPPSLKKVALEPRHLPYHKIKHSKTQTIFTTLENKSTNTFKRQHNTCKTTNQNCTTIFNNQTIKCIACPDQVPINLYKTENCHISIACPDQVPINLPPNRVLPTAISMNS